MGHTPGPWWVDGPGEGIEVHDTFGRTASVWGEQGEEQQAWSNARLIAAAPFMLKALKRAVAEANCALHYEGVDDAHTLKRALERIRKAQCVCDDAISLAEGTHGEERPLDG